MIGQLPNVIAFDPQLLQQPEHASVWNRGCPIGFFPQFVGPGEPGAAPAPIIDIAPDGTVMVTPNPSATNWVRCRLFATTTPESLQRESGVTTGEAIQVFTKAAADTAAQLPGNLSKLGLYALVGLALLAIIAVRPR